MPKKDPRVDAYIEKAAPFARPILERVRKLFHRACPGVEETIKWGCPFFEHKGLVGGMAAFKRHATLGFWKARLLEDPAGIFGDEPKESMCSAKFSDVKEMPSDKVLLDYVRRAVALNEEGTKAPQKRAPAKRKAELPVPDDLRAALAKSKKARATFEGFSPSCRREYIEWITEAKRDATRARRLATAIEWLAEGKQRNWKYR